MKLRLRIFISLTLVIILSIAYDNYYSTKNVAGTYIYSFPLAVPEGPNEGDRLTLKENGHFESDTWGNGTFKLKGSRIILSYSFEHSKAAFETSFYRKYFLGSPRIEINSDLAYYFKQE